MQQQPHRKNINHSEAEKICRKAAEYSSDAPAWPSDQPVIVMPPGSDPISLGMPGAAVYPQTEPKAKSPAATPQTGTSENGREMNTFLTNNLGKIVRLSFRPESGHCDQIGVLLETGNSYLILQEFASQNLFLCDIASVQSVHIYNEPLPDSSRTLFGI